MLGKYWGYLQKMNQMLYMKRFLLLSLSLLA